MPTIVKTDSGNWKAVIRKIGFPTTIKTFRHKRDAEEWARTTEDELVHGMYVKRASAD